VQMRYPGWSAIAHAFGQAEVARMRPGRRICCIGAMCRCPRGHDAPHSAQRDARLIAQVASCTGHSLLLVGALVRPKSANPDLV